MKPLFSTNNDELLAIAFADMHVHAFKAHTDGEPDKRLKMATRILLDLCNLATAKQVPLLFAGDLLHDPKSMTNETFSYLTNTLKVATSTYLEFFGISGNHDFSQKNTLANPSPSYLKSINQAFPTFKCLDDTHSLIAGKLLLEGIPWMDNREEFIAEVTKRNKIIGSINSPVIALKVLLIHSDLPGAKTPEGYEVHDTEGFPTKLDSLWSNYDLVLCGHIHRPQRISKKCIMLGSPNHQTQGDAGIKMGYWEIYKDRQVFVHIDYAPEFIYLEPGQAPYNDKDFFIPAEEPEEDTNGMPKERFSNKMPNKRLVKNYLKEKGIRSAAKKAALLKLLNKAKDHD